LAAFDARPAVWLIKLREPAGLKVQRPHRRRHGAGAGQEARGCPGAGPQGGPRMTDWSELRSGAMPGRDAEEQEYLAAEYSGGGLTQAHAAKLAEKILSEREVVPSPGDPGPGRNRHL